MKAIIDRIVKDIAVLEFESGEIVEIPVSLFKFPIVPQMMLSVSFQRDKKGEVDLQKSIKELKKKL